jgi:hypothetical protein
MMVLNTRHGIWSGSAEVANGWQLGARDGHGAIELIRLVGVVRLDRLRGHALALVNGGSHSVTTEGLHFCAQSVIFFPEDLRVALGNIQLLHVLGAQAVEISDFLFLSMMLGNSYTEGQSRKYRREGN